MSTIIKILHFIKSCSAHFSVHQISVILHKNDIIRYMATATNRILIVDDEDTLCEVLKLNLE